MIPKIIHCFWFSGEEKPALMRKCLASWQKFAPSYEIREWDIKALERRFGDLPRFVRGALSARKWAFASDWARFAVIAAEGGVYLDLDVELVKPIDDLVESGSFFALSSDEPRWVDPGLGFAAEKGDEICAAIARKYETMTFDPECHLNQTCPSIVNEILKGYPQARCLGAVVFNPKGTCAGTVRILPETRAIHWYAASWFNWKQRLVYKILPRMGIDVGRIVRWLRK